MMYLTDNKPGNGLKCINLKPLSHYWSFKVKANKIIYNVIISIIMKYPFLVSAIYTAVSLTSRTFIQVGSP